MQIIEYFKGEVQFPPTWFFKLPSFFWAFYLGNETFTWLGKTFHTPGALAGETLFMYWKRQREKK